MSAQKKHHTKTTPPYFHSECPYLSIHNAIAFTTFDWSDDHRLAWIYGIVCGWGEATEEVAAKHNWSDETKKRLERLRVKYASFKHNAKKTKVKL